MLFYTRPDPETRFLFCLCSSRIGKLRRKLCLVDAKPVPGSFFAFRRYVDVLKRQPLRRQLVEHVRKLLPEQSAFRCELYDQEPVGWGQDGKPSNTITIAGRIEPGEQEWVITLEDLAAGCVEQNAVPAMSAA